MVFGGIKKGIVLKVRFLFIMLGEMVIVGIIDLDCWIWIGFNFLFFIIVRSLNCKCFIFGFVVYLG